MNRIKGWFKRHRLLGAIPISLVLALLLLSTACTGSSNGDNGTTQTPFSALQAQVTALENTVTSTNAQISSLSANLNAEINALQAELAALQATVAGINAEVDLTAVEAAIDALEDRIIALEAGGSVGPNVTPGTQLILVELGHSPSLIVDESVECNFTVSITNAATIPAWGTIVLQLYALDSPPVDVKATASGDVDFGEATYEPNLPSCTTITLVSEQFMVSVVNSNSKIYQFTLDLDQSEPCRWRSIVSIAE